MDGPGADFVNACVTKHLHVSNHDPVATTMVDLIQGLLAYVLDYVDSSVTRVAEEVQNSTRVQVTLSTDLRELGEKLKVSKASIILPSILRNYRTSIEQ